MKTRTTSKTSARPAKVSRKPSRPRKGDKLSAMATHLAPEKLNDKLAVYLYDKGSKRLNRDRLERFGRANSIWFDDYAKLDNGRARMVVGIRARSKLATGEPLNFPA